MLDQILDRIPDIDIEEELTNDEHAHAIPFCNEHHGPMWFPVSGSIVEAMCGKLIRIREYLARPQEHKKCPKCSHFQGKIFHCYVCGKDVVG